MPAPRRGGNRNPPTYVGGFPYTHIRKQHRNITLMPDEDGKESERSPIKVNVSKAILASGLILDDGKNQAAAVKAHLLKMGREAHIDNVDFDTGNRAEGRITSPYVNGRVAIKGTTLPRMVPLLLLLPYNCTT